MTTPRKPDRFERLADKAYRDWEAAVNIYKTPILALSQDPVTASGGLLEVVKLADHQAALAEKDAEMERLREWEKIVLGSGTDESWKRQYDALLAQAIRFAEGWKEKLDPMDDQKEWQECYDFLIKHQKGASHESR